MRSLTLYTALLALSACGDNGGADTSNVTSNATTTGDTTTSDTATEPGTTGTTGTTVTTGDTATGTTTSEPATTGQTSTTQTSTTDTGDTTTAGDTTSADASSGDDTTGDTTGEPATSDLKIAVVDAELYADCQPEVEPDPVDGSWYVEFDNFNGAEATSATLVKASLSLLDADPPVPEPIDATPTESGPIPAGEQTSVLLTKQKVDAHSACEHCDEFYLLELDYLEGDVMHHVTEEVTISCSF